MICFPLDNTEYEANALGAWCGTRTRGVFAADGHFAVTSNDDMTVTVSPGLAWLKAGQYWGVNAFEPNARVLTVDTADGSLSRIDAVCVRLDKNQNIGEVIIKKGSYSPQPAVITPPVRNLDYDEIYVATIMVRAGATSILTNDITDQRLNETYCGIMRDGVTGIPTQQLADQWTSWMSNFTAEAQAYYGNYQNMVADRFAQYVAEIAVHEQNAQQVYNQYEINMGAFELNAQGEFESWFETIKGILDEETAAHLQNEIDALQDTNSAAHSDIWQALDTIVNSIPGDLYTKAQTDQLISDAVHTHNTSENVHGDIRASIYAIESRIARLELAVGGGIATNPFSITFTSLDGLSVTGVWNDSLGRIEF
jgi:hypothetical protein